MQLPTTVAGAAAETAETVAVETVASGRGCVVAAGELVASETAIGETGELGGRRQVRLGETVAAVGVQLPGQERSSGTS